MKNIKSTCKISVDVS